jgi:hypothetical protein
MAETTSREVASGPQEFPEPSEATPAEPGVDAERSGGESGTRSRNRLQRGTASEREHQIEIISSILLAVTTVLTAWSAYEATRWGGVQAANYARASSNRVESTRSFNLGTQQYVLDTNTFNLFAAAYSARNDHLANFYRNNVMRAEFLPFLDRWIASNPLDPLLRGAVHRSPLEDPEYLDLLFLESQELETQAEQYFTDAQEANQTADDYVLGTVFFASVLFFAGISTKFRSLNVRMSLIGAGGVMLLVGLAQIIGLPIE